MPQDMARKRMTKNRAYYTKLGKPIPERWGGPPNAATPNILDAALPATRTIRPQVREDRTPVSIAAPLHEDASSVPLAGAEGTGSPFSGTPATAPAAEPIELEPETMIALTKGAFALVGLISRARTHDDRETENWKVEDDEIREIAEPMCRQAMRIPIIAALGQNTADLILIGTTLGTLIALRMSNSIELGKDRRAAQRPREVPRREGETYRVASAEGGDGRYQEVREPADPHDKPNLSPFAVAQ